MKLKGRLFLFFITILIFLIVGFVSLDVGVFRVRGKEDEV